MSLYKFNLVALAAVADGVGGVEGGDKASAIAVNELESLAERNKGFGTLKDIDEFFKNTYKEINQVILKEQENQHFPDMCTTLVSAGLFRATGTEQCYLFIINCGDSPLLCIDTDRDEIELLSAIHHTGNHLTQYLGKRNLEIHNSYCQCPKNGFILLCSDGLTGNIASSPCVSKEEVKKYLLETKNIDEASEILIKLAQYKGSSDDISVAILEMGKPKRMKPKHLTPVMFRRYRAIAERLVYAGCILLSIIGVFYYKSDNVKLKEILEDDKNELQLKEKEIDKLNNNLRSKDQESQNIPWGLSARIREIEEENKKLRSNQKKLLASKDTKNESPANNTNPKGKGKDGTTEKGPPTQRTENKITKKTEDEKAQEQTKKSDNRLPKNPADQVQTNTGSCTTGQRISQAEEIKSDRRKESTQEEKFEDKKQEVSGFPQIKNNPEEPTDGKDLAEKKRNSEPEPDKKEEFKSTDTSASQKEEGKENNKELSEKTWLMIRVTFENKPLKDASMYIDDKLCERKTGNNGELKIEASIGKHTLKVEKKGFVPHCDTIDFQSNKVKREIVLVKEKSK